MEKLIEDLISRLEIEKGQSFKTIEDVSFADKTLEFVHTGKIFAFDFCIDELERLLEYKKESVSRQIKN